MKKVYLLLLVLSSYLLASNFTHITNKYQLKDEAPIQNPASYKSERVSYVVDPYLQNSSESTMTVMWESTTNTTAKVLYSLVDENQVDTVSVLHSDIKSTGQDTYIYTANLTDLVVNSKYSYSVIMGSTLDEQENYTFKTAPEKNGPFKLVIWGDNRSNPSKHKLVADAMAETNAELAINVGDLVSTGTYYDQWKTQYFNPARKLLMKTPVYVAVGNHEYDAQWFYDYIHHPPNPVAPKKENYLSFTYGPVFIIILDNNKGWGTNTDPCTPGSVQYNWLVSELQSDAANEANWIMVMAHCPPYTNGWDNSNYAGDMVTREHLMPLFEEYGVDLVINGHTHDYERGKMNGVHYVISGGGGSALDYKVNNFQHLHIYEADYHYVELDIQKHKIEYKAINPSGRILDDTTFIKGLPESIEKVNLSLTEKLEEGDETTISWSTQNTSGDAVLILREGKRTIRVIDTVSITAEKYHWIIPTNIPKGENYKVVVKQDYLESSSEKFGINSEGISTQLSDNTKALSVTIQQASQIRLYLPKAGETTISVISASGRTLFSKKELYKAGNSTLQLPLNLISDQMLILKVETNGTSIIKTFNK